MARIITSGIEDFGPGQRGPSASYVKAAKETGLDTAGKALSFASDLAQGPVVGLLSYGAETAFKSGKSKMAESEGLAQAQGEYDLAKAAAARLKEKGLVASEQANVQAQEYRTNLQEGRGPGAQLEQLGRDKREAESLMLDRPELAGVRPDGSPSPLQQRYNDMMREEARLRFELRKAAGEGTPMGIAPEGSEAAQAQGLQKPRFDTSSLQTSPQGTTQEYDRTIPQTSDVISKMATRVEQLRIIAADEANTPEERSRASQAADYLTTQMRTRQAGVAAQATTPSEPAVDKLALRAAWEAKSAAAGQPPPELGALAALPPDEDIRAKVESLSPARLQRLVDDNVDTPDEPVAVLAAARLKRLAAAAPAPAAGPTAYAPPAPKAAPGGIPAAVSGETRELTQRAGERGEQSRKDLDATVEHLKGAMVSAGIAGDVAESKAKTAAAEAYSRIEADNKKFMDEMAKFSGKVEYAIDDNGKAYVKSRPVEPTWHDVAEMAAKADTKEKQSAVDAMAKSVQLPYRTLMERFDPSRQAKFYSEIKNLFPAVKKSPLEEAADVAYKFARVPATFAKVTEGQQKAAQGEARIEVQAEGSKGKIDERERRGALEIDKLTESQRAALARDEAIARGQSLQAWQIGGNLGLRRQELDEKTRDRLRKEAERLDPESVDKLEAEVTKLEGRAYNLKKDIADSQVVRPKGEDWEGLTSAQRSAIRDKEAQLQSKAKELDALNKDLQIKSTKLDMARNPSAPPAEAPRARAPTPTKKPEAKKPDTTPKPRPVFGTGGK